MYPAPSGAATRPRRGRARAKVDVLADLKLADLHLLIRQLGLPVDVGLGQEFRGVLHRKRAHIAPHELAYVEGRLRLTLPELYAVQHTTPSNRRLLRDRLTGTVERFWFDRLRFDAGRLDLPRIRRVYRRWHEAKAADLSEDQRHVLDGVVLLDALHRRIRAEWTAETPDEVGMMLSERFLAPWASDAHLKRYMSPATARRRRDDLVKLGLLVPVEPNGEVAYGRPIRHYRLAISEAELR
jgi:hypothetical protein